MVRVFHYRGKTLEELQKMSLEEFSKYVDARARRQLLRKPLPLRKLLEKVNRLKHKAGAIIKTHMRSAVILPQWVGLTFGVHRGKDFVNVEIKPEMIGRRLGEFAHTTGKVVHSGPGVGATRSSKFVPLK